MREAIRNHPWRTTAVGVAGAVVLAGVGIEVRSALHNSSETPPADSCTSPWATAGPYQNRGASDFELYSGFTKGAVIRTTLPRGALGVEAAWRTPTEYKQDWDDVSGMLPGDGKVAVKFGIGDGPVEFGIRVVAPPGSESCLRIPDTQVKVLGGRAFAFAKGRCPWPTFQNALACSR